MPPIKDALARLRNGVNVPPIDPSREAALLAAFDARQASGAKSRRFAMPSFQWMAAAATLVVVTVSLNWIVAVRTPQPAVVVNEVTDFSGFVAWPGASAWPPFESGSVMRVELPVSLLPTLGLSASSSAAMVAADIVVGQDGFARAVRLVQQQ